MSVISWIESIGGGIRWGAVGGLKQIFKYKWQCCGISR